MTRKVAGTATATPDPGASAPASARHGDVVLFACVVSGILGAVGWWVTIGGATAVIGGIVSALLPVAAGIVARKAAVSADRTAAESAHQLVLRNEELADALAELEWLNQNLESMVQSRTAEVQRKNDELNHKNEALARSIEESRVATRAKSRFLANMSHEIRTPLAGILGTIDMLEDTGVRSEQRDLIDSVRQSGNSLLVLLSNALDLAKVEEGTLAIEEADVDPAKLIEEVAALHRLEAHRKGVVIDVLAEGATGAMLHTDPRRLKVIVDALVDNAVKFTDAGSVQVVLRRVQFPGTSELLIEVVDTGCGITPEDVEVAFEAFGIGDDTSTRRHRGAGLGLAVAHHFVASLGGVIGLDPAPAGGTRAWVRLPGLIEASQAQPEPEHSPVPAAEAGPRRLDDPERIFATVTAPVLVAEDDKLNQKIIAAAVRKFGLEVVITSNGAEAVEAFTTQGPFCAVLMDCQMPVLDGYDATREIRRFETTSGSHTPIMAVTANALSGDRERCLASGMDDFLPKPVDRKLLKEMLARWIAPAEREPAPVTDVAAPDAAVDTSGS